MIDYVYSSEGITADQLRGFFVGWANPPSPEVHLQLLQRSDKIVLALDTTSGVVIGFITAITDRCLRHTFRFWKYCPHISISGLEKRSRRKCWSNYESITWLICFVTQTYNHFMSSLECGAQQECFSVIMINRLALNNARF